MANFTSIFTGNQIESRLANYGECTSSSDSSVKFVTLTQAEYDALKDAIAALSDDELKARMTSRTSPLRRIFSRRSKLSPEPSSPSRGEILPPSTR